jgi:hypothetical protein
LFTHTLQTNELLGSFAIAIPVLGLLLYMNYDHALYFGSIIVHGKIIVLIETWRTTREHSANARVE